MSQRSGRDDALGRLLPKLLGILWERGERNTLDGVTARLENGTQIGGYYLRPGAFGLNVGVPEDPLPPPQWQVTLKATFSVHIDASAPGREYRFDYQEGRCSVLSWKRGEVWENYIAAQSAAPRTIDQLFPEGMSPKLSIESMEAAGKVRDDKRLKDAEKGFFRALNAILRYDRDDWSPELRSILNVNAEPQPSIIGIGRVADLPPELREALEVIASPVKRH